MFDLLCTIAGGLAVALWIYLLLGRGMFWRTAAAPAGSAALDPLEARSGVTAIIPARNEAEVIARSVTSLLTVASLQGEAGAPALTGLGHGLRVIVVDDGSSDGTAAVACAAAEKAGATWALQVIYGQPLPPGWSGKLWAVRQGVEAARAAAPPWLLLTDADVAHAAGDLQALVNIAEQGGYDLASLMVRLRCQSVAERLLIPAFVFFFFKLYPPAWIADARRATAGAAGGCMLIRPAALERIGGIQTIRAAVIDDCALAGAVKRSGGRVWLGAAARSASLRAYDSFRSIGAMVSRTAFSQLQHSPLRLAAALVGLAFAYLLPLALVATRRPLPVALGVLAWAPMAAAYFPTVRYYRLNAAWALTLPAAACFYAGATAHSACQYWRGRGGQWKGRVQDPAGRR
jgi:hopene-associated glycosyltransferase HpnB